jgi:hypothetical protein
LSQQPQGLETINPPMTIDNLELNKQELNGDIVNNVPSQSQVQNEPQSQIITESNIGLTTAIKELSQVDTGKNYNDDNVITLVKLGIQVCTLAYNILPVVGTLYIVNSDHNLVKVIYEPNMVYQTDNKGILHRIGLQNPEVSA